MLLPVSLRARSSTQPISMMRSPPSAERPVVSVSSTIWRMAGIMLERPPGKRSLEMFDLTGKVAVITGGNGGIGLGMARGLAQAGATVVLAGRDALKSAAASQSLAAQGCKADAIEANVTDEGEV